MKHINVRSASDEVQYRLDRLREIMPRLRDKRIVLYGTGNNAKKILDGADLHILGLMDPEYTGKYIFGKKVLSEEEVQLLDIDTVLIAAEPFPTEIVYKRIVSFCLNHHITILDMYGCNEAILHRNILKQEIEYEKLTEDAVKKQIESNDSIVIAFKDVLCSERSFSKSYFYENVNKELNRNGIYISNFVRNRRKAQEQALFGSNVTLKQIYNILQALLVVDETELEKARKIEEQFMVENFVPRIKMLELLKYALVLQKDVYIYSDQLDGNEVIDAFLKKFEIGYCKKILAEKKMLPGLLGRTIRALGEEYGFDKVLCIGNEKSDNMIIPQLYHVNFQIIKSSFDMFLNATNLQIAPEKVNDMLGENLVGMNVLQGYNTPFFNQIDHILLDSILAEKIGWQGENGKTEVELLPIEQRNRIDNIEKLIFPEVTSPLVSIILSVYNQFEYAYGCLKSIQCNTDYVAYEVIVADDHSYDLTAELEKIVSGISVLHSNKNLGFIRNCNQASKIARGKYLMFLHSDTQVQLNWLYPLLTCMETQKDVGLVGAKLLNPDGSLQNAGSIVWNNAAVWHYGSGKNPELPDYNYVREVDYISSAAIIISKELWEEIGGFDEKYAPAYWEDVDLAFEVRKRGKRVLYQPDSVVVHFEGVSNSKGLETEVKSYQKANTEKFIQKWKQELSKNQYPEGENILAACERKQKRKTVLFVSERVPTYDRDAGSRTLYLYVQEFIRRGYIVKFISNDFVRQEPYTYRLEQMGVEVFYGKYYSKMMTNWIDKNHKSIDFVFLNYPNASKKYIDLFKSFAIPVIYYGMDLHYIRLLREYKLYGDENRAKEAEIFYEREKYLIKNSDAVYYPSLVEAEIIKKEFNRNDVKQLMVNIYDIKSIQNHYKPDQRNGIMFIGGYRHTPNVDAVLWFSYQIFPHVYQKLKIPFYIAGADMPEDICSIEVEGIIKLGALTDAELEQMYNQIKLMVVPLRYGAGIKGKVIEAMYHGIPVLTTPIGIEGIPNENAAVRIAENEADFVQAIIQLYMSNEELLRMSVAGQEIIKRYYSREAAWRNIEKDFT